LTRYRVRLTPEASRLIARLSPEVKRLIRSAIDDLRRDPYAGSELHGELAGYFSFRIRRYRIIYRVRENDSSLDVYYVGHRRDIYETFRVLLESLLGKTR
jgi:addiction module RelE/StbE family toxin